MQLGATEMTEQDKNEELTTFYRLGDTWLTQGENGTLLISPDGKRWKKLLPTPLTTEELKTILNIPEGGE